jgi:hypothetical protein
LKIQHKNISYDIKADGMVFVYFEGEITDVKPLRAFVKQLYLERNPVDSIPASDKRIPSFSFQER